MTQDLPTLSGRPSGKTESPRKAQKELTRHKIVRAARACFLSAGVARTSFEDIALRAQVSRATVYLHFASKDQLLLGMLEEDWAAQCELFGALPQGATDAADFAAWLQTVVAAYRRRRDSLGLYALVVAQDPAMADRMDTQRDLLIDILGARCPAFAISPIHDPQRRLELHLMVVQIEHLCLTVIRDAWAASADAGIALMARRLASVAAAG